MQAAPSKTLLYSGLYANSWLRPLLGDQLLALPDGHTRGVS